MNGNETSVIPQFPTDLLAKQIVPKFQNKQLTTPTETSSQKPPASTLRNTSKPARDTHHPNISFSPPPHSLFLVQFSVPIFWGGGGALPVFPKRHSVVVVARVHISLLSFVDIGAQVCSEQGEATSAPCCFTGGFSRRYEFMIGPCWRFTRR